MKLSLSSAAAPDAALAELVAACAHRGLAALELVEGHAHGVTPAPARDQGDDWTGTDLTTGESDVTIRALYVDHFDERRIQPVARFGAEQGIAVVVPAASLKGAMLDRTVRAFGEQGAELLISHGSDPRTVEALRYALETLPGESAVRFAWEFRPENGDERWAADVIDAAEGRIEYVRLHGGGPESARQTGLGIGALMARLTLARFDGPLVLVPSDPRYHYVWRAWLGRAGGWGCGSKQSDDSLVALDRSILTVRH